MSIYLGNLSTKDIESRLGIRITDEEREACEAMREQNTSKVHNKDVWHAYDIPFVIACGSYEVALKLRDIFGPYSGQMKGQLQISGDWDGAPVPRRKEAEA